MRQHDNPRRRTVTDVWTNCSGAISPSTQILTRCEQRSTTGRHTSDGFSPPRRAFTAASWPSGHAPSSAHGHVAGAGGGATGLIGDPRARGERTSLRHRCRLGGQYRRQLEKNLLGFSGTIGADRLWTQAMSAIDFLRDLGNARAGHRILQGTSPPSAWPAGISTPSSFWSPGQRTSSSTDLYGCAGVGGNDQWGNAGGMDPVHRSEALGPSQ